MNVHEDFICWREPFYYHLPLPVHYNRQHYCIILIILCYIIFYLLYYIVLYYILFIILYCIILYYIISYNTILYYIVLYYIFRTIFYFSIV